MEDNRTTEQKAEAIKEILKTTNAEHYGYDPRFNNAVDIFVRKLMEQEGKK
jgi:hypothetical protein